MVNLLDRRFLFVVGKGGVGKSTVSAALALAAARRGKRVLIAMPNAPERLSSLLDVDPIGARVVRIAPNIDAVNMNPTVALEEYGLMILRVRALYKAVFENRLVRAFLRGTPGIEAWSMLGKAFFHASPPSGPSDYDLVILDAQATGHALDMLRVPQVIVNVAPPGLLRKEADRALELFRDTQKSGIVLVTLAEDMPTNETIELDGILRGELRLPVAGLVVNRVLPPLFAPDEEAAFRALPDQVGTESPLYSLARAGRRRAMRERVQRESIAKLAEAIDAPRTELPYLFHPEFGRKSIESLSAAFG